MLDDGQQLTEGPVFRDAGNDVCLDAKNVIFSGNFLLGGRLEANPAREIGNQPVPPYA
ncbi:hypothetical protein D3C74_496540 [compost metagenome]